MLNIRMSRTPEKEEEEEEEFSQLKLLTKRSRLRRLQGRKRKEKCGRGRERKQRRTGPVKQSDIVTVIFERVLAPAQAIPKSISPPTPLVTVSASTRRGGRFRF